MLYGFSGVILQGALVTLELAISSVVLAVIIGLLALALFGYTTFRHFSSRSTESVPSTAVNNELRILRAILLLMTVRFDS